MRTEDKLLCLGIFIGFGFTVAAMALPLWYPNAPQWMWGVMFFGGLAISAYSSLFVAYELLIKPHVTKEVKLIPLTMIIGGLLLITGGIIYHLHDKNLIENKIFDKPISEKKYSSELILSAKDFAFSYTKDNIIMNLIFHNNGVKEFIIDGLLMILPGNRIGTLDDNDNIDNNFNNKATLEHKMPDGSVMSPAGYYGIGAEKSGFPKVLKSEELYPLQINIPFIVNEFLKEKKLSNIKKIPIGLMIRTINYEGRKQETFVYPIAELKILNDQEIVSMRGSFPTRHIPIE